MVQIISKEESVITHYKDGKLTAITHYIDGNIELLPIGEKMSRKELTEFYETTL